MVSALSLCGAWADGAVTGGAFPGDATALDAGIAGTTSRFLTAAACLSATSTGEAPWYIVPADDKKNARLIVSRIIVATLESLKLRYPPVSAARRRRLQAIRRELLREQSRT